MRKPTQLTETSRTGRRPELQDWLNARLFHPLALRLAMLLRPLGVTPNMVSVLGVLTVTLAAIAYTRIDWPAGAIIGFALHLFWHVVDGADGDLARISGRVSANGEFVDGVCDYIGHIALYIILAAMLDDTLGGWAWVLVVLAGASHIAQNNHYESLRRSYLWWAYGTPWLHQSDARDDPALRDRSWFNYVFGWMARDYLTLSAATAPGRGEIDDVLDANAGSPEGLEAMRQVVRFHARKITAPSALLGSNSRTITLGLCMLANVPVAFLLIEIVVQNVLLAASTVRTRRALQETAAAMRARSPEGRTPQ